MSFYWNILSVLGCSLISWIQQWKCSDLFQEYLDYFLYSQGEYLQLSGLFSAFSLSQVNIYNYLDDFLSSQGEYLQLSGWFSTSSVWIFTVVWMIFCFLKMNIYNIWIFLPTQGGFLQLSGWCSTYPIFTDLVYNILTRSKFHSHLILPTVNMISFQCYGHLTLKVRLLSILQPSISTLCTLSHSFTHFPALPHYLCNQTNFQIILHIKQCSELKPWLTCAKAHRHAFWSTLQTDIIFSF